MQMLDCADPNWSELSDANMPPFLAYSVQLARPHLVTTSAVDSNELRALPQSELEHKVNQYATKVMEAGENLARQFDVIHAHDWMSFPAALKLASRTHKPFIAQIHSTEYDRVPHGYGSSFITATERAGMQQAQVVIAVSEYTKRLLVEKYDIDAAKIQVVHNGIGAPLTKPDPGAHHFASKRPVIVFMGRLTMQKGADYFLKLAQSVLRRIPEALFVIAGSGDMYHELLFKTAYDKLSASVVFSGFLRETQKDKLLDRADVFVMPSISEPFGLVALEAAQRHTPVIISKNTGVSEVLQSAVAVDFWDVEQMSTEIVHLLNDASHAQTVREAQLQDVARASWDASAHKLQHIYSSVIRKAML